jgi:hypothetical protein
MARKPLLPNAHAGNDLSPKGKLRAGGDKPAYFNNLDAHYLSERGRAGAFLWERTEKTFLFYLVSAKCTNISFSFFFLWD